MCNSLFRIILSVFLLLSLVAREDSRAAGTASITIGDKSDTIHAAEILKKSDEVRSPWPNFIMVAHLSFEKFNEEKQEVFRVFNRDYFKSLVSYIEPVKQRGNILLMVDDNLWYYVNNTQYPMRITPIQKLSGGASYGDVARLNWSRDYNATMVGEQTLTVKGQTYETWVLKLIARSNSATYHIIDLYIEKGTSYPRKAEVYLQSGKKMKTLYFTAYQPMAGKMMNTKIEFIDHLSSDNVTTLTFSEVQVKKSPDRFFLKSNLPSLNSEVIY